MFSVLSGDLENADIFKDGNIHEKHFVASRDLDTILSSMCPDIVVT